MSDANNKTKARKFIEEVINERKADRASNFLTSNVVYHGMGEEVRGIGDFKRWVSEDLSAFPDMKVTIQDDFGEQDRVAIRWTMEATHEKDFAEFPATHKKFETQGIEIFHFEGDKIKEAWTLSDISVLAR